MQAVCSILVSIPGEVVLGKAIYSVMDHAVPDGNTPEPSTIELAAAQSRLARESVETREIAISAELKADSATAVTVAAEAASGPTHRADG